MENSVRRLIELLGPVISDLDDKKNELTEQKNELESVSRMLAYTKDNLNMVGIYADQNLILNNLSKILCSEEDYRASCYLLNSENEDVKKLPQYEQAYKLIGDIVECFRLYKAELIVTTNDLEKECQEKEIAKKYYTIFSNTESFVDNPQEFSTFLDKLELDDEEKINVLLYTLKNNVEKYAKKNS